MSENQQMESPRTTKNPQKKKGFLKYLLLIVSYAVVGVAVWQIQSQMQADPARQQARAEAEIKAVVDRVANLILLPSDETPQVAAINDAESLAKTQAFFANAKNEDQILIYLKEQKAIIYRPSENKIINVGPIVTDNAGASNTSSNSSSQNNTSSNSESDN